MSDISATKQERKAKRLAWIATWCRGRVLDVGCSDSGIPIEAARQGCTALAVDLDPVAIDKTRALVDAEPEDIQQRIELRLGSLESLDEAERFDTIVLAEVLEHQRDPAALLSKAAPHLASEGTIVVTTPFGWMPDPDHVQAPFVSDHLAWISQAGLHPHEVRVSDNHVLSVIRAAPGPTPDLADLLAQTERATEGTQRFWIGERDRNYDRVQILLASGRKLQLENRELKERLRSTKDHLQQIRGSKIWRAFAKARRLLKKS